MWKCLLCTWPLPTRTHRVRQQYRRSAAAQFHARAVGAAKADSRALPRTGHHWAAAGLSGAGLAQQINIAFFSRDRNLVLSFSGVFNWSFPPFFLFVQCLVVICFEIFFDFCSFPFFHPSFSLLRFPSFLASRDSKILCVLLSLMGVAQGNVPIQLKAIARDANITQQGGTGWMNSGRVQMGV